MEQLTHQQVIDFINLYHTYDNYLIFGFGGFIIAVVVIGLLWIVDIEQIQKQFNRNVQIVLVIITASVIISFLISMCYLFIGFYNNTKLYADDNHDVFVMENKVKTLLNENNNEKFYIIDTNKSKYNNLRLYLCLKNIKDVGRTNVCHEIISDYEKFIKNEIDYQNRRLNERNQKLQSYKDAQEEFNKLKSLE